MSREKGGHKIMANSLRGYILTQYEDKVTKWTFSAGSQELIYSIIFGQSNHSGEVEGFVHSPPVMLPLLKIELIFRNHLRNTLQLTKEANFIVISHILPKMQGCHQAWKHSQIYNNRFIIIELQHMAK